MSYRGPQTPHGTRSRYKRHGCRCALCCEATRAYSRRWYLQNGRKRQERTRLACTGCGGPKPAGRGIKTCGCEKLNPTLEYLIEQQAVDMRRGDMVRWERERSGASARTRQFTVSLDALPASSLLLCDPWADPTFEAACGDMD